MSPSCGATAAAAAGDGAHCAKFRSWRVLISVLCKYDLSLHISFGELSGGKTPALTSTSMYSASWETVCADKRPSRLKVHICCCSSSILEAVTEDNVLYQHSSSLSIEEHCSAILAPLVHTKCIRASELSNEHALLCASRTKGVVQNSV